jgi:hypothetical protein
MPPAHCIQALQLNLKLLVHLVGRSPLATYTSRIIAWIRRLWRWAYKQVGSPGKPDQELDHDKSRDFALQATLPHLQPSALAHNIDDRDENQPGQQMSGIDTTQTVNIQIPNPSPGSTPSIPPPSFPSYPSYALSPTAPELLAPRQRRGGKVYALTQRTAYKRLISSRTKTDVKVTLEPHTRLFKRYALGPAVLSSA